MSRQTHDVPNQPRTPQRAVRVPDAIWFPAGEAAKRRGENLSEIMRDSLQAYLHFTDEQWSDLLDVADRLGVTRARLFSDAIRSYVEQHRR